MPLFDAESVELILKPLTPMTRLPLASVVVLQNLRRARPGTGPGERLDFGRLVIDPLARRALRNGEAVELTSHQFSLLLVLARRAGRVQSRDQLMAALRGHGIEAFDRSIDVHISRIRAAIEDDPAQPQWIQTIRGEGYVFTLPETQHRRP